MLLQNFSSVYTGRLFPILQNFIRVHSDSLFPSLQVHGPSLVWKSSRGSLYVCSSLLPTVTHTGRMFAGPGVLVGCDVLVSSEGGCPYYMFERRWFMVPWVSSFWQVPEIVGLRRLGL